MKDLYSNATPEAQRAMLKSYQESGGGSKRCLPAYVYWLIATSWQVPCCLPIGPMSAPERSKLRRRMGWKPSRGSPSIVSDSATFETYLSHRMLF